MTIYYTQRNKEAKRFTKNTADVKRAAEAGAQTYLEASEEAKNQQLVPCHHASFLSFFNDKKYNHQQRMMIGKHWQRSYYIERIKDLSLQPVDHAAVGITYIQALINSVMSL